MRPTIEQMVIEVITWFKAAHYKDQFDFITSTEPELYQYHHNLGQDIRNHFKLWEYEWVPVLKEGADYSEDHPDHISMEVIKEVWRRVK